MFIRVLIYSFYEKGSANCQFALLPQSDIDRSYRTPDGLGHIQAITDRAAQTDSLRYHCRDDLSLSLRPYPWIQDAILCHIAIGDETMSRQVLTKISFALFVTVCFALNIFAQSQSSTSQSSASQSNAQAPAKPCDSRLEYRQFDFWIGEWDVEAGGQHAGTNSVQLILGGCVIFENWTGARGMTGKSFNIYNAAKGKWQQTWVDSQGNVLELHGEFKDGMMRFTGESPNRQGGKTLHKLTFFPLEGGRVRQLWESSNDDGKTWNTVFNGLYFKKKTAAESK
jgi:hypothetical protein